MGLLWRWLWCSSSATDVGNPRKVAPEPVDGPRSSAANKQQQGEHWVPGTTVFTTSMAARATGDIDTPAQQAWLPSSPTSGCDSPDLHTAVNSRKSNSSLGATPSVGFMTKDQAEDLFRRCLLPDFTIGGLPTLSVDSVSAAVANSRQCVAIVKVSRADARQHNLSSAGQHSSLGITGGPSSARTSPTRVSPGQHRGSSRASGLGGITANAATSIALQPHPGHPQQHQSHHQPLTLSVVAPGPALGDTLSKRRLSVVAVEDPQTGAQALRFQTSMRQRGAISRRASGNEDVDIGRALSTSSRFTSRKSTANSRNSSYSGVKVLPSFSAFRAFSYSGNNPLSNPGSLNGAATSNHPAASRANSQARLTIGGLLTARTSPNLTSPQGGAALPNAVEDPLQGNASEVLKSTPGRHARFADDISSCDSSRRPSTIGSHTSHSGVSGASRTSGNGGGTFKGSPDMDSIQEGGSGTETSVGGNFFGEEDPGDAELQQHECFLEPVFVNNAAKQLFDICNKDDFQVLMDKQMYRNPMLMLILENLIRRLLQGSSTFIQQFLPYFTSATKRTAAQCTFLHLHLHSCALLEGDLEDLDLDFEDPPASPCLFIVYTPTTSGSPNDHELSAQMKRDYMALAHIPSIVTVFGLDGSIVNQNGQSVAYMGFGMLRDMQQQGGPDGKDDSGDHPKDDHQSQQQQAGSTWGGRRRWKPTSFADEDFPLRKLFKNEPQALSDMWAVVAEGKTWHGTVNVPARLQLEESSSSDDEDSAHVEPSTHAASAGDDSTSVDRAHAGGDCDVHDVNAGSVTHANGTAGLLEGAAAVLSSQTVTRLGSVSRTAPDMATSLGSFLLQHRGRVASGNGTQPHFKELSNNGSSMPSHLRATDVVLAAPRKVVRHANGLEDSRALAVVKDRSGTFSKDRLASLGEGSVRGEDDAQWQEGCATSGDRGAADVEDSCWHEVEASRFPDPVTGEDVIMLIQTDVTQRVLAERKVKKVLEAEHQLLENIFPRHVLEAMTTEHDPDMQGVASLNPSQLQDHLATHHSEVMVCFADIVGFTSMCKEVSPVQVMSFLNDLYTEFDRLADLHHVYKVETIGDCYLVAGGLMGIDVDGFRTVAKPDLTEEERREAAGRVFAFARGILAVAERTTMPHNGTPVQLRVGMHCGPIVSGVVGCKMPRFCLFGDTVNTASRMESTAPHHCVHVSSDARSRIGGDFWTSTNGVEVKGRGWMDTYVWSGKTHPLPDTTACHAGPEIASSSAAQLTVALPEITPASPPSPPAASACQRAQHQGAHQGQQQQQEAQGLLQGPQQEQQVLSQVLQQGQQQQQQQQQQHPQPERKRTPLRLAPVLPLASHASTSPQPVPPLPSLPSLSLLLQQQQQADSTAVAS